ncbi:MAG: hypothetical protein ACWGQW_23515, partial [bacterium]
GAGLITEVASTTLTLTGGGSSAVLDTNGLTTADIFGGTAVDATLTLSGSSSGSVSGDSIVFKTEGTTLMTLSGDATPGSSDYTILFGNAMPGDASPDEVIVSAQSQWASFSVYSASTTAGHASSCALRRSRGTLASPASVNNGDNIGSLSFSSYDDSGNTWVSRASINGVAEGAGSGASIPMGIYFKTGSTTQTVRFSIGAAGAILVASTNPLQFANS